MRMDKYSSGSSYWFGGITTMLGALSLNELALVIGIACTVGTFGVNWYYKRKEYQLRERSNVSSSPQ
ncbi:TPA: phage holin family protein [Yersinia enterocolitica]